MRTFFIAILLIFCALPISAQDKLFFEHSIHNFGEIKEENGDVSHIFTGINRSSKPILVVEVTATCGCTVPKFTKKPILPGANFEINVTFSPINRPGTFQKRLYVISSDSKKLATLTIKGVVIPRTKTTEELYPFTISDHLRFNRITSSFSYIFIGRTSQSAIGYTNTSSKAIQLKLVPKLSSGYLEIEYPHTIPAGGSGEINIRYLVPESQPHYGTTQDVFNLEVDGQKSNTLLVTHAISVDNPNNIEDNSASKAQIAKNFIKFGPLKDNDPTKEQTLKISNTGRGALTIRAVEIEGNFKVSLKAAETIAAGDSRDIIISLEPKMQDYGTTSSFFTIITNDPARPMRKIRVVVTKED